MPVDVRWLIEDAVILEYFSGEVNMDEAVSLIHKVGQMIEQSNRILVHTLIDMTTMSKIPTNLQELVKETNDVLKNPRSGWILIYGQENKLLNFFTSVITGVFKTRYRMFPTLEEALEFLQQQDAALPHITTNDVVDVIAQINLSNQQ